MEATRVGVVGVGHLGRLHASLYQEVDDTRRVDVLSHREIDLADDVVAGRDLIRSGGVGEDRLCHRLSPSDRIAGHPFNR